jgi:hypothetical protein
MKELLKFMMRWKLGMLRGWYLLALLILGIEVKGGQSGMMMPIVGLNLKLDHWRSWPGREDEWQNVGSYRQMWVLSILSMLRRKGSPPDCEAKYDAEVELHKRKAIKFTVIRPGGLTNEPAKGAQVGRTHLKSTRYVHLTITITPPPNGEIRVLMK